MRTQLYFLLPTRYDYYYNEDGELVAIGYDAFLKWMQTQPNVVNATDVVDYGILPCNPYKIIKVDGSGRIPLYFYAYGVSSPPSSPPLSSPPTLTIQPRNIIYGRQLSFFNPDYLSLCNRVDINVQCKAPVIGSINVTAASCAIPVIGTITVTPINNIYAITGQGSWTIDSSVSSANKIGNQIILAFRATNGGSSGALSGEHVGNLPVGTRPDYTVIITNADQSVIPAGCILEIDTDGSIKWSSPATTTVEFSNVIFNLSQI